MISVIIPSRHREGQEAFLNKAIQSICAQKLDPDMRSLFQIIVALDAEAPGLAPLPNYQLDIKIVRAGNSQAEALNAGVAAAKHAVLAFLEDDDEWTVGKLEAQIAAIEEYDFVSCNQLEIDSAGKFVRVNDFATPSGWMMRTEAFKKIGKFNTSFKWHVDTEWLGHLNRSGLKRCHLVESTAPVDRKQMAVRPWLACIAEHSTIKRSGRMLPLVRRNIHSQQGMNQLDGRSQEEHERMFATFGSIPW